MVFVVQFLNKQLLFNNNLICKLTNFNCLNNFVFFTKILLYVLGTVCIFGFPYLKNILIECLTNTSYVKNRTIRYSKRKRYKVYGGYKLYTTFFVFNKLFILNNG